MILGYSPVAYLFSIQIGAGFIHIPPFQIAILGIFIFPPIRIQLSSSSSKIRRTVPGSCFKAIDPQSNIRRTI
ncbi:hypothetical protein EVA_19637 [gut metagenome]|uniref:Uncharacterized protein n=1 Tax=gut metagenome TaxID=749906 RepID=J9FBI1_9ZZZZ